MLEVVVVGAGLSGLSAAFELTRGSVEPLRVAVTESGASIGGSVRTRKEDGRLWEEGPNSFQPSDSLLALACDLGLREDIFLADPGAYRFVWLDGQLRALPSNASEAVFGDYMSPLGKVSAALGAFGLKASMPRQTEETLKEFAVRNLGQEAFERLIDPFVSGVYAGDPEKLSAEAAFGSARSLEIDGRGSMIAGALSRFWSSKMPRDPRLPEVRGQTVATFRHGMRQLPDALAAQLRDPVRLRWTLRGMRWDGERGLHELDYDTPDGPKRLNSRAVVLAVPAFVAADLLGPLSTEAGTALGEIKHPRVAAVTLEYPRAAFREPGHGRAPAVTGFGQLHPRSQGLRTLGGLYPSSLFPDRVPSSGRIMLHLFIGGSQDPALFGGIEGLGDAELVEIAHADVARTLLKRSSANIAPRVLGVKVWPKAIPQPELGHFQRVGRAKEALAAEGVQGLFLSGSFVGGVAVAACTAEGTRVAKEVNEFLQDDR